MHATGKRRRRKKTEWFVADILFDVWRQWHLAPAAVKVLSPYVLRVHGTPQVLSTVDLRRRQPLPATRLISSTEYADV